MMMPTVEEICIKDIVTIDINSSIEQAIKKMADSNVRSVLILTKDSKDYYILTTNDAIEYKIQNISLNTKLKDMVLNRVQTVDARVNILEVINESEHCDQYLVVLDKGNIIGILSQTDIINNIDPQILMQRQTIGNLILQYSAITVYEDEATVNAIKLMKFRHVDSVIIMNTDHEAQGIFTTKDFLNIMHKDSDLNKPIKTYMSSPLMTVSSDIKIFEALQFIREKHFKRIVVTDEKGKIAGVITQNELLRIVNNKWLELIKEKGHELSIINEKLIQKAQSLEKKASTDFLTQLYNRRKFDALIEYELKQIKRYEDREMCLLLLDIDGFKYINDTYGHDMGDKILQEIAKIIKFSLRNSDTACRWGGEEFAIALSETNIEDGFLVAEKLRITIENHTFVDSLRLTCSFGVPNFITPILIQASSKELMKHFTRQKIQAKIKWYWVVYKLKHPISTQMKPSFI